MILLAKFRLFVLLTLLLASILACVAYRKAASEDVVVAGLESNGAQWPRSGRTARPRPSPAGCRSRGPAPWGHEKVDGFYRAVLKKNGIPIPHTDGSQASDLEGMAVVGS